jgi:hypothetical protein
MDDLEGDRVGGANWTTANQIATGAARRGRGLREIPVAAGTGARGRGAISGGLPTGAPGAGRSKVAWFPITSNTAPGGSTRRGGEVTVGHAH